MHSQEQQNIEIDTGCPCNLIHYYELVGTEGVHIQERLATAVEGTSANSLASQVFSLKDDHGLPMHPNTPDSVRINPNFDVVTTDVGSSHQAQYEGWVYLEEAGFLRDSDGASESGMVYTAGCCGNLKLNGKERLATALPRTRQQTNSPVPLSAGLHRIRVYIHDSGGTNGGFDLEFSKDLANWANVENSYIAKPKRECKSGSYSMCEGKYKDQDGNDLILGGTIKLCKPTCDECAGGGGAYVEVPEDTLTIQADSLTFPAGAEDNDTMAVTSTGDELGIVTELWKYDAETDTWIDVTVADINTIMGPATVNATNPTLVNVSIPYQNEESNNPPVTFDIPIPQPVSVVNNIDLKPTGNPNEFTVEITYTNDLGVTNTITDTTPVTFPENNDYVEYTGNNTVPTGNPPLGVDTRVLADGTRYDRDGSAWIKQASTCPGPMTRAAAIALRNAGDLKQECHYVITDPAVNGTLDVEKILLHAVDESTFSNCYIKTSHDNIAWAGRYDIDTNRVEFIGDMIGNEVTGNAAIIVFPWGNGAVIGNRVRGDAVLTYVAGNVDNNEISGGSNVRVNSGNFINNVIDTDANVTSSGVNVTRNHFEAQSNTTISSGDFRENRIEGGSTVTSNTSGDVDGNVFGQNSNITVNGASNVDNSVVMKDANVTMTAGNIDNVTVLAEGNLSMLGGTLADTTIGQDGQVTIRSGSNYENKFGDSVVFNQVGTGYVRYSTIDGTTAWTNGNTSVSNVVAHTATVNTTGSAGTLSNSTFDRAYMPSLQNIPSLTITDSAISNYGTVQTNGATRIYIYRCTITDGGRVLCGAGSRIDASYTNVNSYGYIQSTGNGGITTFNYCDVSSLGYLRNTTVNNNRFDRCQVSSQSNMRFDGTATGGRIYYCRASGGAAIYQTTGSVNCYIYYCTADAVSQIYTQGSTNARIYYNSATGYSYIRSLNCPGTHYIYYCTSSGRGYIQISASQGRIYSCHVSSQSILEKRGGGTGNIYYSSFSAYYYAYITRASGTSTGLFGMGRRTNTIANPVAIAPYGSGSARNNF